MFCSGRGAKPVEKITVNEESKDHYKCEYVAPADGAYKVDVKFDGKPVPGSPYRIKVAKGHDASKCKAQGDGLKTAVIDQLAEFDVDCSKAGNFDKRFVNTNFTRISMRRGIKLAITIHNFSFFLTPNGLIDHLTP